MKIFILLLILFTPQFLLHAQQFSEYQILPADSGRYEEILSLLTPQKTTISEEEKEKLQEELYHIYQRSPRDIIPSRGFVTYEKAKVSQQPDTIQQLCLNGYMGKKAPDLSPFTQLRVLEVINSTTHKINLKKHQSLYKVQVFNSLSKKRLKIGSNDSLQVLALAYNPAKFIPKQYKKTPSLRRLIVGHQDIYKPFFKIGKNDALEGLKIEYCVINSPLKAQKNEHLSRVLVNYITSTLCTSTTTT